MSIIAQRDTCLTTVTLSEENNKYILTVYDKIRLDTSTHSYSKLFLAVFDYNDWVASSFKLNSDGSPMYS
jgi:hypothetical protein